MNAITYYHMSQDNVKIYYSEESIVVTWQRIGKHNVSKNILLCMIKNLFFTLLSIYFRYKKEIFVFQLFKVLES